VTKKIDKLVNTSSAVMQQRVEPKTSLDDFPTPPWATRALCEWMLSKGKDLKTMSVREPAANRGHMVKPLCEYFEKVDASDIHDYGYGYPVKNYLTDETFSDINFTITNPPFILAREFAQKALRTSTDGVAIIVRLAFIEGKDRFYNLFKDNPPSYLLQFVERVGMVKGTIIKDTGSATAYCWLVWFKDDTSTETKINWIEPCKVSLEKDDDYPTVPTSSPELSTFNQLFEEE
jgi:hypothetical protein